MKRAELLLHRLQVRGVHLSRSGQRLCVDAPREALFNTDLDELRQWKSELLALLTAPQLLQPPPAGCAIHRVSLGQLTESWGQIEAVIGATPEDDHDAQWSVVNLCSCCGGPNVGFAIVCDACGA